MEAVLTWIDSAPLGWLVVVGVPALATLAFHVLAKRGRQTVSTLDGKQLVVGRWVRSEVPR